MPIKTHRGRLELTATFKPDGPTLARVIALEATRDQDGAYSAPEWTATRALALRHATRLLAHWGAGHFTDDRGSWSVEFPIHEVPRALACARRVVKRHFPEL